MDVIMYVMARLSAPADMISGLSNSTVVSATPPSSSPMPESTKERMNGSTVRHVGHQEAVHNVKSGMRAEELVDRYV